MNSQREAILKQRVWKKPSKRAQVFLVCLLVSAFIWVTRELTKEGNTLLTIPIEIKGLANNLAITSNIPSSIEVRVSSYGLDRFKAEVLRSADPIEIDLEFIRNAGIFDIQSGQLSQYIRGNLGEEIEIIRFSPRNIQIEVEKIISKKVKITPSVRLSYDDGFFLDGNIKFFPDSTTIFGTQSVLDTVEQLYSRNITKKALNQSFSQDVELIVPKGVKSEISSGEIQVAIDEYTEGELYKILKPIQVDENSKIVFFPDSIKITYRVGLNHYEHITPEDIVLEVDMNSGLKSNKKQVIVVQHPEYINNIRIVPSRVEHYVFK